MLHNMYYELSNFPFWKLPKRGVRILGIAPIVYPSKLPPDPWLCSQYFWLWSWPPSSVSHLGFYFDLYCQVNSQPTRTWFLANLHFCLTLVFSFCSIYLIPSLRYIFSPYSCNSTPLYLQICSVHLQGLFSPLASSPILSFLFFQSFQIINHLVLFF